MLSCFGTGLARVLLAPSNLRATGLCTPLAVLGTLRCRGTRVAWCVFPCSALKPAMRQHTPLYTTDNTTGVLGAPPENRAALPACSAEFARFFLRGLPQGSVPRRRTRLYENRKEKKSGHTICTSPGLIETYNIPGDIYANIGRTGCHTLACLVICCVFGFFFILFDSSTDTGGKMLTVTPGITHGAPRGA